MLLRPSAFSNTWEGLLFWRTSSAWLPFFVCLLISYFLTMKKSIFILIGLSFMSAGLYAAGTNNITDPWFRINLSNLDPISSWKTSTLSGSRNITDPWFNINLDTLNPITKNSPTATGSLSKEILVTKCTCMQIQKDRTIKADIVGKSCKNLKTAIFKCTPITK